MNKIEKINKRIESQRNILLRHSAYKRICNIEGLCVFTEFHVYAVWDFMSLLKALQYELTCVKTPWIPSYSSDIRHLINEIVLAEESDEFIDGRHLSHFEMYLEAMQELGAEINPICNLVDRLKHGDDLYEVLDTIYLDERVRQFLKFTFAIIEEGQPHKIAAAFTFGRENLIPDMFSSILTSLKDRLPEGKLSKFIYYFQRHIELDGDEHGPLAMKMILELVGNDENKWKEVEEVALRALEVRVELWNAIDDKLQLMGNE
ncbi:DUF3050 domain-containing protein [Sphingobacterium sp. UT-1RO-CII-1]|uniref:DUF3050 domain-containing protein n=1 Tax=Sphingobacterium sp. UT-1RO-CII-1 TaxID=2995225 RepID=UPI00227AEA17|nr:DUF3050 domain-containing protein [Sphingobacterium sp. UT-1RO-CII-1]MCY4779601.1 DUF3050 domain-containing protein [Sphingobacterium sp. UT-1RO-CII-1]